MIEELTYKKMYQNLLSDEMEEYIPDGITISHPVVHMHNGKIVDCFLLYSMSKDGTKYTVPTARIIFDSEKGKLIDFKTTEEQPFSVYEGVDYYSLGEEETDSDALEAAEAEYQTLYMKVRKLAFLNTLTKDDKRVIVRYVKALKSVEYVHMQPFLVELGKAFFEWIIEIS